MQMRGDHVLLITGEPDGVGEVGGKPVAGEQQRRGDQQNGKRRDREVDDRARGRPGLRSVAISRGNRCSPPSGCCVATTSDQPPTCGA